MDCAGELTTIENRLGRAGGLAAMRDSRLCRPDPPILGLPVLTRSAALLTLLLQDGTVDLELTSSVVALDPALAFGTLQAANLEPNRDGGIWQLPLAVVAAGCDRLLAMVNGALKVESNYDCGTSEKLRQLYLRCVQRACIAELLTNRLEKTNPRRSYLAGLLFGLAAMSKLADTGMPSFSLVLRSTFSDSLFGGELTAGPSTAPDETDPIAASVLIAGGVLELLEHENPEGSKEIQRLAASPLWDFWDGYPVHERCHLLCQGCTVARWAAANAPRLSPWDFMARLHRHKPWE